jgi:hypothetical protein
MAVEEFFQRILALWCETRQLVEKGFAFPLAGIEDRLLLQQPEGTLGEDDKPKPKVGEIAS